MYSGSDSTGSQNYNQWPLNPAAYQNTPNEQIDWAALAQQWIIMKEAGPPVPDQITTAPPPPNIQKMRKEHLSEGGEAPMEVENEKDDDTQPHWNENNASSAEGPWNWNQQQQWGWGNTWSAPSGVPPPGAAKTPLLPTPPSYNQYSTPNENTSNFVGYNRPPSSEYSGGYWTSSNKMKPHNKRYSKVNVPPRPPIAPVMPDPVMLDASKRKQLPAWIREGLEKMERDKQKQLEREREKQEKEDHSEKSKLNEKEALEIIKSTVKEREKSKFDSDGEDSEIEIGIKKKGRETPESVLLSQEELVKMLKVRRTMTEILLKVTNQEIRAVCKEEFQRHLRKHKASDLRVSASSGTNISAKLGVGIYGDSASSSEESGDEVDQAKDDSDSQLKDMIKRRKAEFSKTEREIEERLAAAEKHVDDDSRGGTPKVDDCDSQVDAKFQGHKVKLNDDATPPKSVSTISKRFKNRRTSTSSSAKSDSEHDKHSEHKERKVSRTKKSSSSESSHSQKLAKTRNKRSHASKDTRSITPDRKRVKEKRRSNDRKLKHSESSSSKSSSSRSRKSRSKSVEPAKKRRSKSSEKFRKDHTNNKSFYARRSRSRSSSRSRRSRSYTRSRRSDSRIRRSRSHSKSDRSRKSRSHTRSERSRTRSRKSQSQDRRSRSTNRSRTSHSRHRSKSYSPRSRRHRRLKSRSSSRGKRSHRH